MGKYDDISAESKLLDGALKQQVGEVFQKLCRDVYFMVIVDSGTAKGVEMIQFIKAFATLHPHMKYEIFEVGENVTLEEQVGCAGKIPMVSLFRTPEEYSGISFCGIPGGKEINSFVLAIYNVAGPGQTIGEAERKRIEKIDKKVSLEVCVSLSCHYCADTVNAAQRIASLNPNITATMIDATLYPKLVEAFHIERVPMTIVNGKEIVMGAKTLEEILTEIE